MEARTISRNRILVLDSGVGGLTVAREIRRVRPSADLVYVADDARFPYGGRDETGLIDDLVGLIEGLLSRHAPDVVVIACNTASTIALPALRERFQTPFVGTVPAIKPACAATTSGLVTILGTEGTVKREYTRNLIREFAGDCEVALVGARRLATYAEAELAGTPVTDAQIRTEIAPCFFEKGDGRRTDTIVLACTHYPLLKARFNAVAPWPVAFVDPAAAIARRVDAVLGPDPGERTGKVSAIFTSGRGAPSWVPGQLSG